MANLITAPFTGGGAFPVDERLQKTKAEMLNTNDNVMPDVYMCVCKDDKQFYTYAKENTMDPETGKYRVISAGSGNALWKPTVSADGTISWEKSDSSTPPTSQNIMGPQGPPGAGMEDIVDGRWTIKKYADGSYEAWYLDWALTYTIDTSDGNLFKGSEIFISYPSKLNPNNVSNNAQFISVSLRNHAFLCWATPTKSMHTGISFVPLSSQERGSSNQYVLHVYVKGKLG